MYHLFPQARPPGWRALFALCCACCATTPAYGELTATALARVSSNYLYHGYTKSDDHPVVQAHAGLRHSSGLYTGAWLTQLDFGGAQLELIPYVGAQRKLGGDFRLDGAVSAYVYATKVFGQRADYVETSTSLDWRELLNARLSVAFDISEVMLAVWQQAARTQRLALASTWLLGIANFKSLQALRKLGITSGRETPPEELAGDEAQAQRVFEQDNLLHVALRQLSPEQRGALELVYFHGLHYRDIARVMDCPENTVKTRIFHARKRLREIWPQLTGESAATSQ